MIRLVCPGCQSKLNAKAKLAGRKHRCPKCGTIVSIPDVSEAEDAPETSGPIAAGKDDAGSTVGDRAQAPSPPSVTEQIGVSEFAVPERLQRNHRFLIIDDRQVVAQWPHNAQGWAVKAPKGMVSAKRSQEPLPHRGNFTLVELKLEPTDEGLRLTGITCYQLAKRWALTTLTRADHEILGKITGPGSLRKEQKALVRQVIVDQFMHEVWKDAEEVFEYLDNTDYHSPGTG